jgi:hypothetical protein
LDSGSVREPDEYLQGWDEVIGELTLEVAFRNESLDQLISAVLEWADDRHTYGIGVKNTTKNSDFRNSEFYFDLIRVEVP